MHYRKTKLQREQSVKVFNKINGMFTLQKIADKVNRHVTTVQAWKYKGVPKDMAPLLSEMVHGLFTPEQIAPELLDENLKK